MTQTVNLVGLPDICECGHGRWCHVLAPYAGATVQTTLNGTPSTELLKVGCYAHLFGQLKVADQCPCLGYCDSDAEAREKAYEEARRARL